LASRSSTLPIRSPTIGAKSRAAIEDSIKIDDSRRIIDQPITQEGLLTIQYPEERRLLPERFRYIPMLLWDTEEGEDRCTACGICAKVCPPQCIWIVRDMDDAGKPSRARRSSISTPRSA
jgi:formate hydrogenlyase subunit 6/NADH:ubiquinone oxidoreductase subunit I